MFLLGAVACHTAPTTSLGKGAGVSASPLAPASLLLRQLWALMQLALRSLWGNALCNLARPLQNDQLGAQSQTGQVWVPLLTCHVNFEHIGILALTQSSWM
jgi:hypothetical protein